MYDPNRADEKVIKKFRDDLWESLQPEMDAFLDRVICAYENTNPPTLAEVLSAYTQIAAYFGDLLLEAYQSSSLEDVKGQGIPEMKRVFGAALDLLQTSEHKPKYKVTKRTVS